jgi:cytochrome c
MSDMRVWMMAAAALAMAPLSGAMAQDADAGMRVFNQCRACHTINQGGRNGVGPNLYGVWGRAAGSIEAFRYSAPMRAKAGEGLTWTPENLRAYLTDPKAVVPAGSMSFAGIRNEQQLNDLLAYLQRASTAQ